MELFEGALEELMPLDRPTIPGGPGRSAASGKALRLPNKEKSFARAIQPSKRPRRQCCGCNACQICLENARWERIFNERFADHSYYRSRGLQFSSPLSEAAGG
jgi:hypothetical protein